jgi:hypothetical protein
MNEERALGKLLKGRKVTGEKTLGILPYKIKCKRETELKNTTQLGRRIRSKSYGYWTVHHLTS